MSQRINRCSHCGCDEPIHNDIDGKLYCNNCGMSLEKLEGGLTMKKVELKPCPFCGGEAELTYTTDNSHKPFVRCKLGVMLTPKCVACQYPWNHETEKDAIEAWNRKADND